MSVRYFEDLEVWKLARELTNDVYEATRHERFSKDFVLMDQMRRGAVSIMSNISEGFERGGNQEFIRFLSISKGSCGELRCQLYVALDQGYISQTQFDEMGGKARKLSVMISHFIGYLRGSRLKDSKCKKRSTPSV